jgi:hypothetical protein
MELEEIFGGFSTPLTTKTPGRHACHINIKCRGIAFGPEERA